MEKDASVKIEIKDEKGQSKSGEDGKDKNPNVKVSLAENALMKQKTLVDDTNPSQTVVYDRESINGNTGFMNCEPIV